MKYRVQANPKGGTCYQYVEAADEAEATKKALDNPNGWKVQQPRDMNDWTVRAYER